MLQCFSKGCSLCAHIAWNIWMKKLHSDLVFFNPCCKSPSNLGEMLHISRVRQAKHFPHHHKDWFMNVRDSLECLALHARIQIKQNLTIYNSVCKAVLKLAFWNGSVQSRITSKHWQLVSRHILPKSYARTDAIEKHALWLTILCVKIYIWELL